MRENKYFARGSQTGRQKRTMMVGKVFSRRKSWSVGLLCFCAFILAEKALTERGQCTKMSDCAYVLLQALKHCVKRLKCQKAWILQNFDLNSTKGGPAFGLGPPRGARFWVPPNVPPNRSRRGARFKGGPAFGYITLVASILFSILKVGV